MNLCGGSNPLALAMKIAEGRIGDALAEASGLEAVKAALDLAKGLISDLLSGKLDGESFLQNISNLAEKVPAAKQEIQDLLRGTSNEVKRGNPDASNTLDKAADQLDKRDVTNVNDSVAHAIGQSTVVPL